MKRIVAFFLTLLLLQPVMAQNELDALRYSQLNVVGTARYSAMGGAFGALGGDMTTLSVNPAGIGVFNLSTGSITLGILSASTDATYLGSTSADNKLNLNVSNAGFVARFKRKKAADKQWAWKSFHLGVSYNRTANFQRRTSVIGVNTQSSILDGWVNQLNSEGINYNDIPFDIVPGGVSAPGYMGWQTFLIDTAPGSVDQYLRNVLPYYGQTQQVTEVTKGSMGEVAVSFGGNFGNAFYIGGTIGIPRLNYELERRYTESDTQDTIANFSSFSRTDYLQASGTGFNIKFGMIYRPAKWIRLGAAIHSPSFFEVDEAYSSVIISNLDGAQYSQSTLDGTFDYSLQTPFRAMRSLAFVIGKVGVVSADYEYVNYSLARFRSRNYSFDAENTSVSNRLNWAGNIRVGTEWRIKSFSIRGGFALNADPYTSQLNFDDTRYSLGAGIRLKRFFVDLTYALHRTVGDYAVYDLGAPNLASTVTLDHNVLTTVGFRF
ncbi:MAG: hypothetical protein KDB98_00555 [Flavobacteriales bacterium]|nr:hypothetical protein [Flavobacteriales bacterium]